MTGRVLVTGGTGYVGSRLIAALESRGVPVRALARRPEALRTRVAPHTEVVAGDALDRASLVRPLDGVHTAYYLVHSMGATADFADLDRQAATNFSLAARAAGVRRIVYLGGLGDGADDLSPHLRSRHETGVLLRKGGVSVVELRASIIIGSGSLSYEMIRALVERLPVMICPRWVDIDAQPIAIDDVIAYLTAALDLPDERAGVFEIGGPDVVSYGDIMREYARQRGLRRLLIPVPLLTPHLSSLWLGLVTPLYARVGRKLIDGLRNATVVRSARALETFPIRPRGLRDAIARAIASADSPAGANRWSDARSAGVVTVASRPEPPAAAPLVDRRDLVVEASPAEAFTPIRRIGGARGWYFGTALWHLRGALDVLVGGVGMRRGRRDPESCAPGDALDFWRVQAYVPDRTLHLEAEMKMPGRAWLRFDVEPIDATRTRIRQEARFVPAGLMGQLYWWALWPVHVPMFSMMLRRIGRLASLEHAAGAQRSPRVGHAPMGA
jgi:uncharacterized protein YbjT (DUF2867 family)